MKIFGEDGRLIIPLRERKEILKRTSESKLRYTVCAAYCPKGCSILDNDHVINGFPGLRIGFGRSGVVGEMVISAVEGDFTKIILKGQLEEGVKYELFCSHCGEKFSILVNCNCRPGAEMVVIGLTSPLDYNDAITFCNVTGCSNGAFIQSGEAILHARLQAF